MAGRKTGKTGRPPKYETPEERRAARCAQWKAYRARLKTAAVQPQEPSPQYDARALTAAWATSTKD